MNDSRRIEQLAERLSRALPAGEQLREHLRKNFRAVLNACLARMDLVTREEFDVQSRVLARTRVRLEAAEKEIERLEAHKETVVLRIERLRYRPLGVCRT